MKISTRQVCLGMFLAAMLLMGRFGYAQAIYGSLFGTIVDNTGAVVPNAKVTVTDVAKGTQNVVQSNGEGYWRADNLIPDTYTIQVESGSFAPGHAEGVEVNAGASQVVNVALQVQGSQQSVTVTSQAPPLKTDRAEVSEILNERSIQELPNLTRNFTAFALLTPGMQHSSFNIQGPENPQGGLALNSNGSNYGVQGFLLDGTDNRDPVLGIIVINPTLDSIGELKVTTQNYDAEFGGAAGGIISASTRSGSNNFHGDAFWFRHSDYLEARDPFAQSTADPITHRFIPSTLYSQFGGRLGGPIIKNKAFFFIDYQGLRQRLGASFLQSVPTNTVRNTCLAAGSTTCDLSQYITSGSVYRYPVSGGPAVTYAPNAVPVSALSPQALNLLRQLPAPNTTSSSLTQNNFAASGNGTDNGDQADIRLDYPVNAKIRTFGRYDYALYRLAGAPAFGAIGGQGFGITNTTGTSLVQNQSVAVGADDVVNASLLTDVRFGFFSYHVSENKFSGGTPATAAGIPNLNTVPDTSGLPSFNITDSSISNFGNQNCNCPLLESEQVFQVNNNWTKVLGNHTIKFGGDVRYALNLRNASDNNRSGVLNFNSGATAGTNPTTGQVSLGSGLASLLFGDVNEFQRFDVYQNNAANRQKRLAFYGQDSYRVTQKLTVNYGVRWDIIYPETVNAPGNGGFASIVSGGTRVAGVAGIGTNGNQKMDYLNLAGRFGFAYQVLPNTVVRGGIGQVYDSVGYFGTIFGSSTHNLPVLSNEDITASNAQGQFATTLAAPPVRPPAPTIPSNGIIPLSNTVNPNFRPERIQLPKVDQWNIAVQQQFGANTTLELAYVGNHAERIYPGETYGYDLNAPILPSSPAEIASGDIATRRPFFNKFVSTYNGAPAICCSNPMTSEFPAANARYNALQTKLDKRFAHGLQFNANYTWSKALGYANDNVFARYPRVSFGPNDTNREHLFVISGVYQLPFGKNRMFLSQSGRLMDYLVGGYSISGDSTWQSGARFTPTYAECGLDQDLDNNFNGPARSSDCRPNIGSGAFTLKASGLNPVTHSVQYFSPSTTPVGTGSSPFGRPAFATFGNIGRNPFVGPRQYMADAAILKDIPIKESVRGQFQFQAFNVFNHPVLDIPNASGARCVDCSNGGVITNIDANVPMRQLQFAFRVEF
jgi:Carboxypeptidase regulatory-like domain/TonB dependent receptor